MVSNDGACVTVRDVHGVTIEIGDVASALVIEFTGSASPRKAAGRVCDPADADGHAVRFHGAWAAFLATAWAR